MRGNLLINKIFNLTIIYNINLYFLNYQICNRMKLFDFIQSFLVNPVVAKTEYK